MAILRPLAIALCAILVVGAGFEIVSRADSPSKHRKHVSAATLAVAPAPTSPPVAVCGDSQLLTGSADVPANAVRVPSGDDQALTLNEANTIYWFAPGVHSLGNSQNDQIIPADGDSYIGAPGAILSGRGINDLAFTQHAKNVKVEYLTIEDFGPPGGNQNQGVVNADSGSGWTISHDTIEDNAGAGVMLGTSDVLTDNCLTKNQQYGFSSYTPSGPRNITITDNEVSYNDTYNWEKKDPGCGCSGGAKLWDTHYATVADNYVHDNLDVGLWADGDNVGIDFIDNYISNNFGEGVMYEIGYNGLIENNTFIHDAVGEGPENPSFPTGAIYISESGSSPAVASRNASAFDITGNVFKNNWSGVILWENSNRFCGPDSPDNAGTLCTLVAPTVASPSTCVEPRIANSPLFADCRWRTMNVDISDNTFDFSASAVGNGCEASKGCGFNGLFSEYGITAPYKAWVVPRDISDEQNNRFADNTYSGPWHFMAVAQGTVVSYAKWTHGFVDRSDGSDIHFDGQDQKSTFKS